jgi:hypothetical protein
MKPSYGYATATFVEELLGVKLTREQADAIVEHLRFDPETGLLVNGPKWWRLGATSTG